LRLLQNFSFAAAAAYYKIFLDVPDMDKLKQEIKELIISALELEDVKPENIKDGEPIFGSGLGLDSIDALELGIALKKKFGVKFSSENADNRKNFASVDALAAYITAEQAGGAA
jgi:acyl carrier protein